MQLSSFALAIDNGALREEAEKALGTLRSGARYYNPLNLPELFEGLAQTRPEILLVDVASFQEDAGSALREIHSRAPDTKIVALHPTADPHWILQSLRGGATEFVNSPLSETLPPALVRIDNAGENGSRERKGKVIAFLSAKGGCGATTIACHTAAELHRQTKSSVLLADMDLSSGLVGFLMKAGGDYSILDAARNLGRLDGTLWQAFLSRIKPGFSVLPAPSCVSHREYPDEVDFQKVLRFMRTQHDWSVVDLGRSLTSIARAALNDVDELFVVSTTEVIALHGLKSIVHGLEGDLQNSHKIHLVLNRAPKMMDLSRDEMDKILGRPLYATLPNDYPSLYQSYAQGNLVPEGSKLGQHFARFTARIIGAEEAKPKRRFALFG